MAQIELKIVSRSGRDLGAFTLPAGATLADLKAAFAAKHRKWGADRQYFTREVAAGGAGERLALSGTKSQQTLASLGVNSGDTLTFKDLGLQVGYRTVFYVEYAGPLLIHAAFYFLQPLFYGKTFAHSAVQQIAFACVAFHYLKREFESAFVHQFSNDTMPWTNIFKNSFHYWLLGGAAIAYFLYHPSYTAPFPDTPGMPLGVNAVVLACVAVFVVCELGNLSAHLTLKNLRPPGTKRRAIPRGGLFELVACPNYFFETGAWLAFCIFTQTATGYFFLVVSTAQMAIWAAKKHKQYKVDFGDEYKNLRRKKMFPFIW